VSNLPAADTPKVAIITGAGSGIGRAVALKLLANDFRVVLAGRRENALQETLNLADKNTVNGLVVPTDVTDANSVQRLFDCAAAEFGRVDVLFNNAGISASGRYFRGSLAAGCQRESNRAVLLHSGRFSTDEATVSDGWPDYQQRIGVLLGTAAEFVTVHSNQARHYRADQSHVAGRS
jgi:NAD(P)-dependent dehydrogenase (short-subunit alcohol dehydrogenase family)